GPPHTLVLMQLASPEAFKQSEEAVSGAAPPVTELPFVNILSHLAKADVPVPALYYYDQPAGLLYLEDVGDVSLAQACQGATRPDTPELYRHAVDLLVRLHLKATFPADPACLASDRAFDVPPLLRDSYLSLDQDLIDELVIRYLEGRAKASAPLDRVTFLRLFDLTSIQRNLKAAGRFVYIALEKHNDRYLQYIPRTLGYVRRNLEHYRDLHPLRKALARYVPELGT